jgi:hypothetical protein
MFDLILRGARLGGDLVAVAGGRIERVAPGIEGAATREVDAGGRLLRSSRRSSASTL